MSVQVTWGEVGGAVGDLGTFIPLLVGLSTFSLYAGLGHAATPERTFPSLALLNSLIFPLTYLPMSVTAGINAMLALRRIQAFLLVRMHAPPSPGGQVE